MLIPTKCKELLINRNLVIFSARFCSTQKTQSAPSEANSIGLPVRVRFAPSPTGYLHVGGLRTALYNYLFAKANNGAFIVRIEDTDQSRTVVGAQESLFRNLEWAGIKPDESVLHGGNFGPYVQSQRIEIYRREVEKLLENGSAYYCFCTERRLELLRKDAFRANEVPKYDNRCRHLTPTKVVEKLANHDPKCIRFKLESHHKEFDDIVYGRLNVDISSEGDPIIIKSDGFPTYHFANVVDDHFMEITHVLRGVEWQVSTPKHLMMYQAFGWTPPQYAHLPLLLNSDGSKLSKRHDHANVDYYRKRGVFPQALVNYITSCGGGFAPDYEDTRSHTIDDLITTFDIKTVRSRSNRLQPERLDECNRLEIKRQTKDPILCDGLVIQLRELIEQNYPNEINLELDDNHIQNALHWASDHLSYLQQFVVGDPSFLWTLPKIKDDYIKHEWLDALCVELEQSDQFNHEHLKVLLRQFCNKNDLSFGKVMASLRSLLSSHKKGYKIAEMMEILGKRATIQRITRTKDTHYEETIEKKQ